MDLRLAISHDWLIRQRGAENVLKEFCLAFKDVSIYALFLHPQAIDPVIRRQSVYVSPLGRWPGVRYYYRYLLPRFPSGMDHFQVTGVDLLLSISHAVAKGIPHESQIPHICYCLTPIRYLWSERRLYFRNSQRSIRERLLEIFSKRLQDWDLESNRGVDFWVAISRTVQERIQRTYGRQSDVIYPCVDLELFQPLDLDREDFYLVVSRLVSHKWIDLAVEAFNRNGKPLLIVGEGSLRRHLARRARSNVRFLGWQPDQEVRRLYCRARALIFPGTEDFGLVPVEAQACGCPVIAYGEGGATETVIEGETGLFFRGASAASLCEAVQQFERRPWDPVKAVANGRRFSRSRFLSEWQQYFRRRGFGVAFTA